MYLRKISRNDAEMLVDWRNANAEFFPPRETPLTIRQHLEWYEGVYVRSASDHMYLIESEEGYYGPVGTIGFNTTDDAIQRVMRGVPDVAPGIMYLAMRTLMTVYDRQCYHLEVLKSNMHAIRFYHGLGFEYSSANLYRPDSPMTIMHCDWYDEE